jgi:beta-galactosidase/beta-glucuronidase
MNTNGKGFDVDINTPWTGSIWNRTWYESKDYEKYRENGNTKVVFWLQPDKYYAGVAWYQKEITIPQGWENKQIILTLERCHWTTSLWLDGDSLGSENSLATPHRYLLSNLKPGKHTLSIRIDNKVRDINPGLDAHSISDNTQSNWNGIVGAITLEEHPLAFISSVKITPNIANKQITAEIQIQSSAEQGQASLYLQATNKTSSLEKRKFDIVIHTGENTATLTYPMGDNPLFWDEFNPNLYVLQTELQSKAGDDQKETIFGMREMSTKGTQITVNGNPIFIRGTLECCIFSKS